MEWVSCLQKPNCWMLRRNIILHHFFAFINILGGLVTFYNWDLSALQFTELITSSASDSSKEPIQISCHSRTYVRAGLFIFHGEVSPERNPSTLYPSLRPAVYALCVAVRDNISDKQAWMYDTVVNDNLFASECAVFQYRYDALGLSSCLS